MAAPAFCTRHTATSRRRHSCRWPRKVQSVEQMQVKYPWLGLLDGTMGSARECIAKPESALFERAIRAFHLDPAHTLFVENNAANVAAACELGLHAVRFESAEQIRALLLPVS